MAEKRSYDFIRFGKRALDDKRADGKQARAYDFIRFGWAELRAIELDEKETELTKYFDQGVFFSNFFLSKLSHSFLPLRVRRTAGSRVYRNPQDC